VSLLCLSYELRLRSTPHPITDPPNSYTTDRMTNSFLVGLRHPQKRTPPVYPVPAEGPSDHLMLEHSPIIPDAEPRSLALPIAVLRDSARFTSDTPPVFPAATLVYDVVSHSGWAEPRRVLFYLDRQPDDIRSPCPSRPSPLSANAVLDFFP